MLLGCIRSKHWSACTRLQSMPLVSVWVSPSRALNINCLSAHAVSSEMQGQKYEPEKWVTETLCTLSVGCVLSSVKERIYLVFRPIPVQIPSNEINADLRELTQISLKRSNGVPKLLETRLSTTLHQGIKTVISTFEFKKVLIRDIICHAKTTEYRSALNNLRHHALGWFVAMCAFGRDLRNYRSHKAVNQPAYETQKSMFCSLTNSAFSSASL